jgi:hypothetical protein
MDIRSCAAHVCFWGKADIANGVRDTAAIEAAALRFLSPSAPDYLLRMCTAQTVRDSERVRRKLGDQTWDCL